MPIFEMLVHLKSEQFVDVRAVHAQMLEELHAFETRAAAHGLSHQHVQLILYALAATADDTILQTPWAKDSDWTSRTLISAYFQETWGGERFFTLLQQMMTAPHTAVREVEFYFFCIEFGFEGKFRLASNGPGELSRIQDDLFQFLRSVRGTIKPDLSPSWRGLELGRSKPRDLMVHWLGALGAMAALLVFFLVLSITLRRDAGLVARQVDALLIDPPPTVRPPPPKLPDAPAAAPPVAAISPASPVPAPVTVPARPAPPPTLTPFQIISNALAPDIKAGTLTVMERDGKVVIRTRGEVFASASTSLRAPFPVVLKSVASAIGPLAAEVNVRGFTDNVPIRSATFPDNLALSLARAQRVADMLGADITATPRPAITATGRGAEDPVASNDTPEGRQSNRRVEILVTPL
ncbi:type IVB secretion system protein IcmH/DotU [Aquabacter sp. L1I39]|uniref:type IVB secretion system protein IcmH/DotU n=1 Tax=Aquabacter sp. L1I39 TaxID=2820278 RepID=UPI001AD98828|nr:type IVB secretion system protein IcmH/DotU [Aquabacter sp. L1I39]QTL01707.1 type IVB secretion system protein IcmH/DotU [Aquabacter sp. L1I39]